MARDIESLKKSIDRFLPSGDRSYKLIDEKEAVVRFGDDLFVCDIQKDDPESCMLRLKVCEVDDETFGRVEDFVKKEIENIDNYLGKSAEDDMIPGTPDKLTPEEKKKQEADNQFIPDGGESKDDDLIPD